MSEADDLKPLGIDQLSLSNTVLTCVLSKHLDLLHELCKEEGQCWTVTGRGALCRLECIRKKGVLQAGAVGSNPHEAAS